MTKKAPSVQQSDVLLVSSPALGVYLLHKLTQRPVEGTAVYYYDSGSWVCEDDGKADGTTRANCVHVEMALKFHEFAEHRLKEYSLEF